LRIKYVKGKKYCKFPADEGDKILVKAAVLTNTIKRTLCTSYVAGLADMCCQHGIKKLSILLGRKYIVIVSITALKVTPSQVHQSTL
jgi:hypothetical protein